MSAAEDDAYYTEGDEPNGQGNDPIHKLPANYFGAQDSDEMDDEELQAIAQNIGE